MTRTIWALSVGLLLGCGPSRMHAPTYAGEEPEPEVDEAAEAPPPAPRRQHRAVAQPYLWRVGSGARPSYLFGTMHVGVAFDEAFPADGLEHIDAARIVFQEVDPEAGTLAALAENASLPINKILEDYITPRAMYRLSNELLHVTDVSRLPNLRPWVSMIFLQQKRADAIRSGGLAHSMDEEFHRYVQQQGVHFQPLETVEDQAVALGSVSDEIMGHIVRDMVLEPERLNRELDALIEAYLSGDAAEVRMLLHDNGDAGVRAFHAALFDGRSERWFEVIEPELEEGGLFVAVGLGHILGPGGLLRRLRQAGHAVERL
ncbi:MAG: hypothetical protein ACI9KE_003286 [Polyangiales bacterium]|jgi:uncharacterized protein YbaP (TraB family)